MRCKCYKQNGEQCQYKALQGKEYCGIHKNCKRTTYARKCSSTARTKDRYKRSELIKLAHQKGIKNTTKYTISELCNMLNLRPTQTPKLDAISIDDFEDYIQNINTRKLYDYYKELFLLPSTDDEVYNEHGILVASENDIKMEILNDVLYNRDDIEAIWEADVKSHYKEPSDTFIKKFAGKQYNKNTLKKILIDFYLDGGVLNGTIINIMHKGWDYDSIKDDNWTDAVRRYYRSQ